MMKLDLFANRVSRLLFVGGVVRIEFCLLQPDEKGEVSQDTPVGPDDVHFTVTLPLGGYSRSVAEMRKFNQELQSKGVLKQQEQPSDQQGGGPQGGPQGGGQQGGGPKGGGRQGRGRMMNRGRRGGQGQQGQQPDRMRRQRELTDLTSDSNEEPLV